MHYKSDITPNKLCHHLDVYIPKVSLLKTKHMILRQDMNHLNIQTWVFNCHSDLKLQAQTLIKCILHYSGGRTPKLLIKVQCI